MAQQEKTLSQQVADTILFIHVFPSLTPVAGDGTRTF